MPIWPSEKEEKGYILYLIDIKLNINEPSGCACIEYSAESPLNRRKGRVLFHIETFDGKLNYIK
jgi:hypothetical protein